RGRPGKPGERSPEPGAAGRPGAARGTSPSEFQGAPSQPEDSRPPARKLGEEATPGQGGPGQIPPQERNREPRRQRFGTPPPAGAGEHGQRRGGPPSGFRQPVTHTSGGGSHGV